mgnify:CR=1 FL=1
MSENQNPLAEEQTESVQTAPEAPETEESILSAEADSDTIVETTTDGAEEEPVEEEDIDPADVRIFGMPRVCFHYTAFGVAVGYLVSGIIGMAGYTPTSALSYALQLATLSAVVCIKSEKPPATPQSKVRKAQNNRQKSSGLYIRCFLFGGILRIVLIITQWQ